MVLCATPAFSIQALTAFVGLLCEGSRADVSIAERRVYPQPGSVRSAFDDIRLTDKRPTPQHVEKEADWSIRGDPKSLSQLTSSGSAAQSRRGKTPAQKALEASSSKDASSQGSDNANKGGNDEKK